MATRPGIDLDTILKASTEMANTQGLDEVTLASLAKNSISVHLLYITM